MTADNTTAHFSDRKTRTRHWLLLGGIATLLCATLILSWGFARQKTSLQNMQTEVETQIGYLQSLRLDAADLKKSATGGDNLAAELNKIKQTTDSAWASHWSIIKGHYSGRLKGRRGRVLNKLYHQPPYSLAAQMSRLVDLAESGVTAKTDDARALALVKTANLADGNLTEGLSRVSQLLQRQTITFQHRIYWLGALLFPAVMALLVGYHALVYRPMSRDLARKQARIDETEQKLETISSTDPLTEIANRKAMTKFMSDFQRTHTAEGEFVALGILDIDNFSQINDVFGYYAGDAVLREVASRIQTQLRDEDKLGRLGEDRFAVVLSRLVAPKDAEMIIDRIQEVVARPFRYKKSTLSVTTTVGASVQDVSTLDLAELFKLTDQALLQAKRNRRGSVFLLSDQAQEALARQRQILNAIRNYQPAEIFSIAYQPIVSLANEQIVGCECLLRWKAEEPINLHPEEFIPILEMFGDIHPVGAWVLSESMRQLAQWQADFPTLELTMSVNVSALQLASDNYAQQTAELAAELNINPANISLELTETVAMKQVEQGRKQLALLRNFGFGVSLDDFGTGYSSLQYLKSMPVSCVKIDQIFVRDMITDPRDAAIVESAIRIAQANNLVTVAEGIETSAQAASLRELGCTYGQGFHFSRPADTDTFYQLLKYQADTIPQSRA